MALTSLNDYAWNEVIRAAAQAYLAGTGSPLPATVYSAQQAVTGAAVALASSGTLVNGIVIKAGSTNANPVYVGPSGVSSATGYRLNAGEAISYAVSNASGVYIIGTAGTDVVYVTGN